MEYANTTQFESEGLPYFSAFIYQESSKRNTNDAISVIKN